MAGKSGLPLGDVDAGGQKLRCAVFATGGHLGVGHLLGRFDLPGHVGRATANGRLCHHSSAARLGKYGGGGNGRGGRLLYVFAAGRLAAQQLRHLPGAVAAQPLPQLHANRGYAVCDCGPGPGLAPASPQLHPQLRHRFRAGAAACCWGYVQAQLCLCFCARLRNLPAAMGASGFLAPLGWAGFGSRSSSPAHPGGSPGGLWLIRR